MASATRVILAAALMLAVVSSAAGARELGGSPWFGGDFSSFPWLGGNKGGGSAPWANFGSFGKQSVVCKEKGSCYNKKLTCPAKCFHSYSSSGKHGGGGGGGGGGCTFDCKKCKAFC